MSPAEQLYQTAVDEMSIKERIARSVELFNWSREFMGRQIRTENPAMSEERIKLLVALRMYGSDSSMKRLLENALADVPN